MRLVYIWKGERGTFLFPTTLLLSKHLEGSERVLVELVSELQTLPCTQESSSKYWLKDSADVWIPTVLSYVCWENSDKTRKYPRSDGELLSK